MPKTIIVVDDSERFDQLRAKFACVGAEQGDAVLGLLMAAHSIAQRSGIGEAECVDFFLGLSAVRVCGEDCDHDENCPPPLTGPAGTN